ncbi:hypothetical protein AKJ63_02200, partial [candidate division MSBL1 archaeon SCGC-AAA259D18]
MSEEDILNEIAERVKELENGDKLESLINEAISQDIPVEKISEEGLRKGLSIVGDRYESGSYFLAELSYAGEIVTEGMEVLKPYLQDSEEDISGKMVLGTVEGDIHDIGKNIVKMLLVSRGWQVQDLGVDVPPAEFVEAIKEYEPDVVGMSALLTT